MKKYLAVAGLILLAIVLTWNVKETRAQSPVAFSITGSASHSTCLAPAANQSVLCVATDGIWISNDGAAYFQVVAPSGGTTGGVASITINGVTKTGSSPAFTISGVTAAPTTTSQTTAPPTTITAQ